MTPDMGRGTLAPEILDDATTRALFLDVEPQKGGGGGGGQGRVFRMSFDTRQYDPAEVSVRCEDSSLVVEAKHVEQDSSGPKVAREFQRRIQLPPDVDPGKLTSTLSADGILTVEAPVPPRYQAVAGPAPTDTRRQNSNGWTLAAPTTQQPRASPVTVRLEPGVGTAGRSASPFRDGSANAGGRLSPFAGGGVGTVGRSSPLLGNGAFMPVTINTGMRSSPVPFTSLAPVTALAPSMSIPGQTSSIDVPSITTDPATGQRRMELALELGRPYTADDVVVRVDGRRLTIDARHESRDPQGHVSSSTTQKQFDVEAELDASTVRAKLRDDGRMIISGFVKQ